MAWEVRGGAGRCGEVRAQHLPTYPAPSRTFPPPPAPSDRVFPNAHRRRRRTAAPSAADADDAGPSGQRRPVAGRGAGAGVSGGAVGAGVARRGVRRCGGRGGIRSRRHPAHARAAADVALSGARRHPLDPRAHRPARAGDDGDVSPHTRDRCGTTRKKPKGDRAHAARRTDPDADRDWRCPAPGGHRRQDPSARLRHDRRRARGPGLQRSETRKGVHLRSPRGARPARADAERR